MKEGGERRKPFRISKKEQQGTEELNNQSHGYDLHKKSTQMKPGVLEQALAHRNSIGQGNPLFPEEKGQTGKGHNAQAAHLDKQENYRLTSTGEFLAGISHYQTGNTGRRGGGEQGIQPGYGWAVAAKGTVQKTCSDNDRSQKEKNWQRDGREKTSDFIAKANIHSGVEVQRMYFFQRSLRGDYKGYSPYLQ